jgi:dihydroorotase
MIGLETSLSLGIRELVGPGYITMEHLIALLTCNPAAFYRLNAGTVREGAPADLVLFDPEETWTVGERFASRSSNSPFIGQVMPGVVKYTVVSGEIVYRG